MNAGCNRQIERKSGKIPWLRILVRLSRSGNFSGLGDKSLMISNMFGLGLPNYDS